MQNPKCQARRQDGSRCPNHASAVQIVGNGTLYFVCGIHQRSMAPPDPDAIKTDAIDVETLHPFWWDATQDAWTRYEITATESLHHHEAEAARWYRNYMNAHQHYQRLSTLLAAQAG